MVISPLVFPLLVTYDEESAINPLAFCVISVTESKLFWKSVTSIVNDADFITLDIKDFLTEEVKSFLGDSFHELDSFSKGTQEFIKECIWNRSCLIYCDGGDKELELDRYSRILRPGSIIGCHDYGTEVDPKKVREFMQNNFVEILSEQQIKELGNLQQFWMRK